MSTTVKIPLGIKLLFLFTVVPLVELILLIWLSQVTSFLFTIGLVIISGLVGATMAKEQGLTVWFRAQQQMQQGQFPANQLIDGIIILMGGALLVTPGVLTDLVGFSTLIPPLRALWRKYLQESFKGKMQRGFSSQGNFGGFRVYTAGMGPGSQDQQRYDEKVTVADDPDHNPFEDESPFKKLKK